MCGITGFISLNPDKIKNPIQEMTDALSHRGPDAGSIFVSESGNFSFGHRRLSIIDLNESANQPMTSACGNYVIVFNGEVYNFMEVKRDLLSEKNLNFKTNSDTEVFLEALIHWGKNAVNRFNGMFAFALYNLVDNSVLFGRDRLGKKPLYYFHNETCFAFASELKSIKLLVDIYGKFSLDQVAINQYLRLGYIQEPHTIYNEVKKLESGSLLEYNKHKIEISSYWKIDQHIHSEINSDEKKAKKELDELLNSSVEYRLIADVPKGVFLSGGVDSSIVAAIAQKQTDQPINTFSIGFTESKYNESVYAEAVAKNLGTSHHTFEVSHNEAIELVSDYIETYDEPYADASGIPTMLVAKLAREHVTMVLTGDGADEQFLGYGMYIWANRLDSTLAKNLKKPIQWGLSNFGNQRMKRAASLFDTDKETDILSHIFSVEQYFFTDKELNPLLKKSKTNLDLEKLHSKRVLTAMERQSFFDISNYLIGDLLVKVDRATMRHSLEARCPFLDYRMLEFSLNLDEKLKFKNGEAKYLLKQVLYDYLPKEIFDRPKWGFGLPIRTWLRKEMRFLVDKYLNEDLVDKYELFNVSEISRIKEKYLAGSDAEFNKVWMLMCLTMWLEKNQYTYE